MTSNENKDVAAQDHIVIFDTTLRDGEQSPGAQRGIEAGYIWCDLRFPESPLLAAGGHARARFAAAPNLRNLVLRLRCP